MGKVYTLFFGEGVFTQYLESKSKFNHINLRDAEFLNLEEAKWTRKELIKSSNGKIAEDQVGIVEVEYQFIPADKINMLK